MSVVRVASNTFNADVIPDGLSLAEALELCKYNKQATLEQGVGDMKAGTCGAVRRVGVLMYSATSTVSSKHEVGFRAYWRYSMDEFLNLTAA